MTRGTAAVVVPAGLIAVGLLLLAVAWRDPEWFFRIGGVRTWVRLIGRRATRAAWALMGLAYCFFGVLLFVRGGIGTPR